MSRPRKLFPSYPKTKHKASGQARITIPGLGQRYLGPFGSPESYERYAELYRQHTGLASGPSPVDAELPAPVASLIRTVRDLVDAYTQHYRRYYRDEDGRPTVEQNVLRQTLRVLVLVAGETPIGAFGPRALRTVRDTMTSGSWAELLSAEARARREGRGKPVAWTRKTANHRCGKIVTMFGWAVSEELVPVSIHQALLMVPGLKAGRSEARETDDVPPVAGEVVAATVLHLGPVVGAMVQVQRLAGMRPGEVCRLRPGEIDRDGPVIDGARTWIYRPTKFKTKYLGKNYRREVVLGPQAQEALAPFLDRPAESYCFDPRESEWRRIQTEIAAGKRRPDKRRRQPDFGRTCYSVSSYGRRIRQVCQAHGIEPWFPLQLRHTAATEIGERFGVDAARAVLGHRQVDTTTIYAARSLQQAAEIAAKMG